ncbi:MAG: hypothetical protein E7649_04310 [Ruminococcaceae bacterium]|nr:hypothetical protein [Oscillospiraceae bacterium]
MAKRKKQDRELDAILEQLKRSYSSEVDTELEDSLLEDEESDDDAELSSILAKIFSDTDDDDNTVRIQEDIESPKEPTLIETEHVVEETDTVVTEPDSSLVSTVSVKAEAETQDYESCIESTDNECNRTNIEADAIAEEHSEEHVEEHVLESSQSIKPQLSQEEQDVDTILNAMLKGALSAEESLGDNDNLSSNENILSPVNENSTQDEEIDGIIAECPDLSDTVSDYSELELLEIADTDNISGDLSDDQTEDPESYFDDEDNDFLHELDAVILDETTQYDLSDHIESDDIEHDVNESDILPPVPHIVLDSQDYISDPLQLGISDLHFLKFDEDIVEQHSPISAAPESAPDTSNDSIAIDSGDVSLLVKFGYGDEISSQIGKDTTQKILFDKQNKFTPEPYNVPFGYTGKEFSDKNQAQAIRQKYKSDRFTLLLTLIALSALTLLSFVMGLIFEFSADKLDYYPTMMSFDFLLVGISALICGKRIVSGAIAISRFETNAYSVLLIVGGEYLVYNLLSVIIYLSQPALLMHSFAWISGSCVLAYFAVIAVYDLINCEQEYKSFELMVENDSVYTAEKIVGGTHNDLSKDESVQNAYRVKKVSMIGGYFKKTSDKGRDSLNPIYILGVLPSIALALSCCSAILSENAVYGIHTFMMISMICIPLCCICLGTVVEYISSIRYRKNNAAFIGHGNEHEYASTSLLVFDDTEAVEITSYKEINPGKNAGNVQEKLIIAYNVLKTLGGPLGTVVPDKRITADGHDLVINSIADNGINVYFDSSTNILIGDRQYMLSYNLKVKTDVNLTTATKGADRSVIYMAFDGKPQLGFVLTSRIKSDFASITSILNACRIAISVESYEPEINDTYFDQNKPSEYSLINVHKPAKHQAKAIDVSCDSTLIARDALSLSKAVSECRNEPARKKRVKKSNILSFVVGATLSVCIAIIMSIDTPIKLLDFLREHPSFALYASVILSAIPSVINAIKEYLRK